MVKENVVLYTKSFKEQLRLMIWETGGYSMLAALLPIFTIYMMTSWYKSSVAVTVSETCTHEYDPAAFAHGPAENTTFIPMYAFLRRETFNDPVDPEGEPATNLLEGIVVNGKFTLYNVGIFGPIYVKGMGRCGFLRCSIA